jgi:hypothetical protein
MLFETRRVDQFEDWDGVICYLEDASCPQLTKETLLC